MKWYILVFLVSIPIGYILFSSYETKQILYDDKQEESSAHAFQKYSLKTDTSISSVAIDTVLSGGVSKDGIPALYSPKRVSLEDAQEKDNGRGIYVSLNGESVFYPYSILVWHEIINDIVGGIPIAVTFCPLCSSGIVYDRRIDDAVFEFGVSGLLLESNLLMYDKKTESLWSQSRGEAVIGKYTGTKLTLLPLQLLSFGEVKTKFPNTSVVSRETGHLRNYSVYPYGDYEQDERILFPVSHTDKRFFAKELFYIIPIGEQFAAIQYSQIISGERIFSHDNLSVTVKRDGDVINAYNGTKHIPGYYELWFSFITSHKDDGVVLESVPSVDASETL